MLRKSLWCVVALTISAVLAPAHAQSSVATLDQLLEQTRSARAREAQANKEREAKFLADRNKQSAMLQQAKAELAAQERRAAQLSAKFDENDAALAELETQLTAKSGNLGEMFGVVRQVAGDFSSTVHNSLISAQYPDREDFVSGLTKVKSLPSIDDLERFWFEMQREMTETGKVVLFNANVIEADGSQITAPVVRIGGFTAATEDGFVNYLPGEKNFAVLSRQPARRYVSSVTSLMDETSGYHAATVDPTSGVLLSVLVEAPGFGEQVKFGGLVGYLILFLGAVGLIISAMRFLALMAVNGKVAAQRKAADKPNNGNPLGRVINVYARDPDVDQDTLQLRLDEAVLKEIPPLETGLSAVKLLAAVAPLMGLLGTVTGMIVTFQQITLFGTGDPKIMAGGISQALVTTVMGLVVAIPMVLLHAFLASRSKNLIQILDEEAAGIIAEHAEKRRHA